MNAMWQTSSFFSYLPSNFLYKIKIIRIFSLTLFTNIKDAADMNGDGPKEQSEDCNWNRCVSWQLWIRIKMVVGQPLLICHVGPILL